MRLVTIALVVALFSVAHGSAKHSAGEVSSATHQHRANLERDAISVDKQAEDNTKKEKRVLYPHRSRGRQRTRKFGAGNEL